MLSSRSSISPSIRVPVWSRPKRWPLATSYRRAISKQALVREGNLRGVRGPHGGYSLSRNYKRITAEDIMHAARRKDDGNIPLPVSSLINEVVRPALDDAERSFATALRRIGVEELARAREKQK